MMLNREESLKTIVDGIAWLVSQAKLRGSIHLLDSHIVVQNFFCRLLNVMCDLQLVVTDNIHQSFPAIDLGDESKKRSFQITSESTSDKIQSTINAYVAHDLGSRFGKLQVIVIGERQSSYKKLKVPTSMPFAWEDDIIDAKALVQQINALETEKLQRIAEVIRSELRLPGQQSDVRRGLLGVSAVGIFPTPEGYFGPFDDPTRLFHHCWALVGRVALLQSLRSFATSAAKRIAVFSGRGGIGKTKLLHAFSTDPALTGSVPAVRFLAEGLPVTPEALADLPESGCIVVVDDAHRRGDDLPALLALAQQCRPRIKLVLASRPQGMDLINSLLGRAGFDEREVERLGTVGDLTREETRLLAAQSLGEEFAHLADRLVAVTRDCPLVTVVGGRLLADRAVDPALLEAMDDFRAAVLSKFHDVLVGHVGDRIEPAFCRPLLALLSAVAPVSPDAEAFQTAAATFLKCDPATLATAMAVLEESGVLLRRGHRVRVTPDVLADHLLNRACLTQQGKPTGFARRVFDHFSKVGPTEVLRNLAELDWRVRHATGQEPDLLGGVWSGIAEQFRSSPNSVRCQLLDLLRDIAYYQPARMFELVEYAVRNTATTPEAESVQHLGLFSHAGVLEKLPELLRRIAYTLEYLPSCADLLWELGRDDGSNTNSNTGHPIRILCGMAEYEIDKPYAFNEEMVAAVRRWLGEPGAHDHAHSPLEVLDPLLIKAGSCSYAEGHSISIRTFKVSCEDTQGVRDEALALIRDCAFVASLKVVLRALKSLRAALSGPMPIYNMTFTADDIAQWVPEQLRVLAVLAELRGRTTDPLVHLQISEAVGWHARYASSPDVLQQARAIVLSLPDQFDVRLARALVLSHDRFADADFEEETTETFHRRHEREAAFRRGVAEELWKRTSDPELLTQELNRQIQTLQAGGRETNACLLLDAIIHSQPHLTEQLIELVIASPDCPLAGCLALMLAHARHRDLSRGVGFARQAVTSGHLPLCRTVANLYCWSINWSEDEYDGDMAVLRSLLRHPDKGVQSSGVGAIRGLSRFRREDAVAEVLAVELGDSGALAEELFSVFHPELGIPLTALTDDDIDCLLRKMAAVSRLDHHVVQFIAYATSRRPQQVIALLLDRVEEGEGSHDRDFEPLSYLGLHSALTALGDFTGYEGIVRLVRDRSLRVDYRTTFWFPKLFKEVSLRFCPASLTTLAEWIDSGSADRIAAATVLLTEAPAAFVFDHREFVSNALVRAWAAGDECYRRVCFHLRRCAAGHGRQRVGGGPFPQDVSLRDRATAIAATLRPGSPDHKFYASLRAEAVANIRATEASDEELLG